jgi:surface protein
MKQVPWKKLLVLMDIPLTNGGSLNYRIQDMSFVFFDMERFNEYIGSWSWNVSNVTDMSLMFNEALAFNQDVGSWDVSNVTTMNGMFWNAEKFNQDKGSWDVSNVTTMDGMFWNAESFNRDIGAWDVSNVTIMTEMFNGAPVFNQDLRTWDASAVFDRGGMFGGDSGQDRHFVPNAWQYDDDIRRALCCNRGLKRIYPFFVFCIFPYS